MNDFKWTASVKKILSPWVATYAYNYTINNTLFNKEYIMGNFETNTAEFISVTEVGRNLGQYMESLQGEKQEKFIILRNNEPEAVLLSMKLYEFLQARLQELEELVDDFMASKDLAERLKDKKNLKSAVTLEELGKRHGL
jgi:PHD/YefM family antitoxin component YafN of YafNO toxin-antitoxin module